MKKCLKKSITYWLSFMFVICLTLLSAAGGSAASDTSVPSSSVIGRINSVLSKDQYQIQASRVVKSDAGYEKIDGICNMCALVNLLNRNLAADGLYSDDNKFDIEYVTRVSCLAGNNLTADAAKTMTCEYKKSLTYLDKGTTKTGAAVICDYDTGGYLSNPVFSIGKKNYQLVRDEISSDPKQQIIDLLEKNPEGVFVRGLYGENSGHCFVITGYENGTFKVIDTATSQFTVDQPLDKCWYSGRSRADLFNRIQYIVHLEETSTKAEIVMPGKSIKISLNMKQDISIKHKVDHKVSGTVTSEEYLKDVTVAIYDMNGNIVGKEKKVSLSGKKKNSYDLSGATVNDALKFNTLEVGKYKLVVKATDNTGESDSESVLFSVDSFMDDTSSFVEEIVHKQDVKIGGKLKCCCKFNSVTATIINAGNVQVASKTVKPSANLVNFSSSALNNLDFGALEAGNYKLKIDAVTQCGMVYERVYDFSVKHDFTDKITMASSFVYGKNVSIGGSLNSCCKFESVTATITTASGVQQATKTVNPSGKSIKFSESKINSGLNSTKLPVGTYKMNIVAVNEAGVQYKKTFDFSVVHEIGNSSVSFASKITYGKDSSISGTIKANCCGLSYVEAKIVKADGSAVSSDITSNKRQELSGKKSFSFSGSQINSKLNFGKLPVGDYKLIIEACEKTGVKYTKTFDFTVQHVLNIDASLATTVITQGSSCNINGSLTSSCKITSATGTIVTASGGHINTVTTAPNENTVDLKKSKINSGLKFAGLAPGGYKLVISTVNEVGQTASKTIDFTVVKKEATKLTGNLALDSTTITQGNSCNVRGDLTSGYKITSVVGTIVSQGSGAAVQTVAIAPDKTTVDIAKTDINYKLKFATLSPGNYILVVTATDANGKFISLEKGFTVVAK